MKHKIRQSMGETKDFECTFCYLVVKILFKKSSDVNHNCKIIQIFGHKFRSQFKTKHQKSIQIIN